MWPIEAVSFRRIATVEQLTTAGTDTHVQCTDTHTHTVQLYRIPRAAMPRGMNMCKAWVVQQNFLQESLFVAGRWS